jgi:gluconolactonase
MTHALLLSLAAAGAVLFAGAAAAPQPTPPGGGAPSASQPAGKSPVAPGAKPVKLADGFQFTEGATADKDGNVYFIDQPNDRIMKWTFAPDATADEPTKGTLSVFLHPSGYSNGMSFDKDGNLVACADEKNELWLIHAPFPAGPGPFAPKDLKIDVLIKDYKGKLLNAPNDIWIVPETPATAGKTAGGMYLTDPLYSRTWWGAIRPQNDRNSQQPGRYVYYLAPDHKTLTPVLTDFTQPNGIIGTPDGKTLYVSDINAAKTWKYTIKDDGTLSDKTLFCNTGSDGMTIDDQGNIYTTHGRGLMIWDKNGNKVDQINMQCANICFGGKNKDILFINSSNVVWALKVTTHGVGPS